MPAGSSCPAPLPLTSFDSFGSPLPKTPGFGTFEFCSLPSYPDSERNWGRGSRVREPSALMRYPPLTPLWLPRTPHSWEPQVWAPRRSTPSPRDPRRATNWGSGGHRLVHRPNLRVPRVPPEAFFFPRTRFGGNPCSRPSERGHQGRAERPVPLHGSRRQAARAGRCDHRKGCAGVRDIACLQVGACKGG